MKKKMSRRRAVQMLAGAGAAALALPRVMAQAAPGAAAPAAPTAGTAAPGAGAAAPVALPPIPPAPDYIAAPEGFGVADGPFKPSFDSLSSYTHPEWYRDAKLGLWAHWGPQCQPEMGDWYAQKMYQFNSAVNKFHVQKYGHPSKFGFKDVMNEWKAENWDPVHLLDLYKKAGAKFFAAMANHHDNMDMWNSKYQPWNTVNVGPKKDIIGGWEKATRAAGLRFAVTCHGDRSWDWMQVSRDSDTTGPMAGVPYDGFLTKEDGKGKWWEGLDPQHLYGQNHVRGRYQWTLSPIGNAPPLEQKYKDKFFNRVIDLLDQHKPDLLYFDDTVLPMYGADQSVGLRIAAYFYNTSLARTGKLEAVMTGKGLNAQQRKSIVLDVERGVTSGGETLPWQTDTCIGSWHYEKAVFDQHKYKTALQVVQMLIDIVSKNGTLMLNIPLKGDGTPDSDELKVLAGLTSWIEPNGDGIFATRPWKIYGEGPSTVASNQARGQFGGARDVRAYTAEDFRFTCKGETVYAFAMGWPTNGKLVIKSMATGSEHFPKEIGKVDLLGSKQGLAFKRDASGLEITMPDQKPNDYAYGLKITPQ